MKTLLKIFGVLVILLVLAVLSGVAYVKYGLPDVGAAPNMNITADAAKLARGEYLAMHVAVCIDCHSTRDFSLLSGPPVEGTFGMGGEKFGHEMGFPGTFYARNITPAAIGDWSDGEIYRAVTMGVSKDGSALFNLMPYARFGEASKEDIEAIIAYIKTLKPIENQVPKSEPDFPLNLIINTLPHPPNHQPIPDKSDVVAYGKYMVNLASCIECHTPFKPDSPGQPDETLTFAGGFEFKWPNGAIMRSANITPDIGTGIGSWNKDMFIQRFKMYTDSGFVIPKVDPNGFNSPMPWTMYAGMTTEDLSAIYDYLRTLTPIEHTVVKYTPPPGS